VGYSETALERAAGVQPHHSYRLVCFQSARNFSSTKDPQSFRGSDISCGSRSASAHLCWWRHTTKNL